MKTNRNQPTPAQSYWGCNRVAADSDLNAVGTASPKPVKKTRKAPKGSR